MLVPGAAGVATLCGRNHSAEEPLSGRKRGGLVTTTVVHALELQEVDTHVSAGPWDGFGQQTLVGRLPKTGGWSCSAWWQETLLSGGAPVGKISRCCWPSDFLVCQGAWENRNSQVLHQGQALFTRWRGAHLVWTICCCAESRGKFDLFAKWSVEANFEWEVTHLGGRR